MRTSVEINGMKIFANHGVLEQERVVGNKFEVSVRLDFNALRAMISDSIDDTVNYAEAVEIIRGEMSMPSQLLENVAYRICKALTDRFKIVDGGRISICKLQPPIPAEMQGVEFTLEW